MSSISCGTTPAVIICLRDKLEKIVRSIEVQPFYAALFASDAPRGIAIATLKNIFLDISRYQPHVTESTFAAVGRMPKNSESLIRTMILQQVEEVEHAEMAFRDYVRLGGETHAAESRRMSPEACSVAAMVRMLGMHQEPAAYLGFMYLFEALTPIVTRKIQSAFENLSYPDDAREFIDLHAIEDVRHTDMVEEVIEKVVELIPNAEETILWAFDCFACVYPIPLWNAAYHRAISELVSN